VGRLALVALVVVGALAAAAALAGGGAVGAGSTLVLFAGGAGGALDCFFCRGCPVSLGSQSFHSPSAVRSSGLVSIWILVSGCSL
jgi:hypothetical protein